MFVFRKILNFLLKRNFRSDTENSESLHAILDGRASVVCSKGFPPDFPLQLTSLTWSNWKNYVDMWTMYSSQASGVYVVRWRGIFEAKGRLQHYLNFFAFFREFRKCEWSMWCSLISLVKFLENLHLTLQKFEFSLFSEGDTN